MAPLRARLALATAVALGLGLAAAPSALAGTRDTAHSVRGVAPRGDTSQSDLQSVACPGVGDCVAVGTSARNAGDFAILDVATSGEWSALSVPLPANAAAIGTNVLDGVACATTTDCVAVGSYLARGAAWRPLLVVEAAGSWSALEAPLPPGAAGGAAASDTLATAACPDATDCVAVGSYTTTDSGSAALLDVESSGTWSAVPAPLPADAAATPQNWLGSVSCTGVGDCVAAGDYLGAAGQGALLDVDAGGTWSNVTAPLPADASSTAPDNYLDSVACTDATDCVAVGSYAVTAHATSALLDVESAGTWANVVAAIPANASAPDNTLDAVSCPDTGDCVAVGSYAIPNNGRLPLVESEAAGAWSNAVVPLPSDASGNPFDSLGSVSCWSAGDCLADGFYAGPDGYLYPDALLEMDTAGSWQTGPDTLPSNAAANPDYSVLSSVSCAGFLSCVAVGDYVDTQRLTQALLQYVGIGLVPAAVAPSPPGDVVAVAGHGQAKVSWTAPVDDGGSAVTGYRVVASPGGHSCATAGATSCTVRPLSPGTQYEFRVTATTALGQSTSAPSAPISVAPVVVGTFTISPFPEGSAALTPLLESQIDTIANHVVSGGDTSVTLVGYNDDDPKGQGGVALSAARAAAVRGYLAVRIRHHGVGDVSITTAARGDADPVASNSTAAGRAQNRRVVARLR